MDDDDAEAEYERCEEDENIVEIKEVGAIGISYGVRYPPTPLSRFAISTWSNFRDRGPAAAEDDSAAVGTDAVAIQVCPQTQFASFGLTTDGLPLQEALFLEGDVPDDLDDLEDD